MAEKSFIGGNAVPIIVTIIVLAAGSYILYQQGYFAKEGMSGSIFRNMQLKLFLEEDGVALVGYAPPEYLTNYMAFAGNPVPSDGSMVLGFTEGGMMAEEDNLTFNDIVWGFDANEEFLDGEVKVTGILAKTGTLLDMMHLVPKSSFNRVNAQKLDIKFNDEGMPKFFYYINGNGSNWPPGINFTSGSKEDFVVKTIAGKKYYPLVFGSEEAKMMKQEGMFKNTGDRLEGFFGKNVFVAGILAPTNSSLDMLHYTLA